MHLIQRIKKPDDLEVFPGGIPLHVELKMPLFRLFHSVNQLKQDVGLAVGHHV
jgi:hypothetical protein